MRWLWLLAIAMLAAGCNGSDCAKSPDIQVMVAPDGDVPVSDVVRLRVVLSVAGGPMGTNDILVGPDRPLKPSGSTFLLRPDPAPAPTYAVSLVIQAYDAAGELVAIGSDTLQATSLGCNRMTVHLTALPIMSPGDMAAPPGSDLAGMQSVPDLGGCVGALPDEDADGRADVCDLCPADYDPTPTDGDADGLPDACDPDPGTGVNTPVYIDLFTSNSGHWSGNNTISGSSLLLDSGGISQVGASNATDMMPLLVRVEAYITPIKAYGGSQADDTGIYIGTSADASQGDGVFCALSANGGPDTLDVYQVHNGGLNVPTSQSLGGPLQITPYRVRLTQRGGTWTCEALVGTTPVTVTTMKTVAAPLFITLHNDNMKSTINSVFAASKLP